MTDSFPTRREEKRRNDSPKHSADKGGRHGEARERRPRPCRFGGTTRRKGGEGNQSLPLLGGGNAGTWGKEPIMPSSDLASLFKPGKKEKRNGVFLLDADALLTEEMRGRRAFVLQKRKRRAAVLVRLDLKRRKRGKIFIERKRPDTEDRRSLRGRRSTSKKGGGEKEAEEALSLKSLRRPQIGR